MKLLGWIAGLLLCVVLVLVTLPFSGAGTRVLVGIANQLDVITVEYRAGRLFGEMSLARVALDTDSLNLQLEEIDTDLQWRCFWHSEFCLQSVAVANVQLLINAAEEDKGADERDTEFLEFPYAVDVKRLDVGSLDVRWPGGQWRQEALAASVSLAGDTITVAGAQLDNAVLQIEGADEPGDGYAGFDPPDIFLPLVLAVDGLRLQAGKLLLGDEAWSMASAIITGRWAAETLVLEEIEIDAPTIGRLGGSGAVRFKDNWPLSLNVSLVLSDDLDLPEIQGRGLSLSAEGDLDSLEVSLDSDGEPKVAIEGTLSPVRAKLPLSLDWQLAWQEAVPLAELLTGLPDDLAVTKPVSGHVEGNLQEQRGQFRGELRGAGYEELEFESQWRRQGMRLDILQLDVRDGPSDSALTANGTLEVNDGWSLNANIRSPGFLVPPLLAEEPGRLLGGVALVASGSSDTWQVALSEVELEGTVNGLPAYVAGASGINSDLRLLPGTLEGEFNGARLSLAASEVTGEARASLQLDQLGRWMAGARGSLTVQAQGDLAREQFAVEASGRDLAYGELELGAADATGSWDLASGALQGLLSLPSLEFPSQELTVTDVQLQLSGDTEAHQVLLSSAGDFAGGMRVDGAVEQGVWRGVLQASRLSTPAGDWTLREAVALAWDGQASQFTMDAHCWEHEQFQLCGDRLRAGAEGDLQLRLAGDARALSDLLPRGLRVRGPLSADLQASWGEDRPLTLEARGRGTNITVVRRYGMGQRVSVTWEKGEIYLRREAGELIANASVTREGREVFAMNAQLPEERSGPMSGTVKLDGLQLAAFSPWFTELSELSGELSGNLVLSGSPVKPLATGRLQMADGHMVALANPTPLTDLQLTLTLTGDRGELAGRGLLGGGELQMQGQLFATPELRLEMQVQGERHQVLVPPASELEVSEDLLLVLSDGLLEVSGNVRIHEGVLRHEELSAGGVSMSSDVVLVDVNGVVIQEERPFEIRSDVSLNIRDRFRVEGQTLRATLGGDLNLVREPGRPLQVFGSLGIVGGELNVYRQRLQIQRGTIAFSGPPDNPELNIAAEREIRTDNVTVGARLIGRLDEPEIEIYSSPAMSQSEAMSYLVRGRGLDSGAGADGTALALSLGADVVNQSGMVAELNRLPLISNVSFGATGDEDDTAATVSGYIGERIYLSYGIGIYEPINVLTARLYLQSRLWLEVVSRLENSVDLYYSFDID